MKLEEIQIKETGIDDFNDIMEVENLAFGHNKEAELVADLLKDKSAKPIVSLLAFHNNTAVGHILFTRAYIGEMSNESLIHLLAPLAVIPEFQKQGIGGMLINEGLKKLKEIGSKMVFVLGHIEYYPKYGFIPDANRSGFPAPYPIPEEFADAWMVQTLTSKDSEINHGKIICANELNKPEHWRE